MHVPLDSEISDFLLMHDKGRRQEVLRTLLKIGFSTLVKNKETKAAVADGFDPEMLLSLLSHFGAMGGMPGAQSLTQNQIESQSKHREYSIEKSFNDISGKGKDIVESTTDTQIKNPSSGYVPKEQIDKNNTGVTYMSDEVPAVQDFDLDEEITDPFAILAAIQ